MVLRDGIDDKALIEVLTGLHGFEHRLEVGGGDPERPLAGEPACPQFPGPDPGADRLDMDAEVFRGFFGRIEAFRGGRRARDVTCERLDLRWRDAKLAEDARWQAFVAAHEREEHMELIEVGVPAAPDLVGKRGGEAYKVVAIDMVGDAFTLRRGVDDVADEADVERDWAEREVAEASEMAQKGGEEDINGDEGRAQPSGLFGGFTLHGREKLIATSCRYRRFDAGLRPIHSAIVASWLR